MIRYIPLQIVELFHLIFLDQIGRKIDKRLYALKGGCNLRFYLKSIRYSQDIDFDIHTIRKETLKLNVNRILESQPFQMILNSKGIALLNYTEPKQTETTQRWKIQLRASSVSTVLNTKIEFSRRENEYPLLFEPVDPLIISHYQLNPIFSSHYTSEAAFEQKIWALILRNQTQARDLFDLDHLINIGMKILSLPNELQKELVRAQETAMSIDFESFKGQVVSYLPLDYQEQYSDRALWESMVLRVCSFLGELKCGS